ncbi:hypothetical protein ACF1G0_32460 [Streptomyces sp. NPDC013953]
MGLVQGLGLPLARSDPWQLAEGHPRAHTTTEHARGESEII